MLRIPGLNRITATARKAFNAAGGVQGYDGAARQGLQTMFWPAAAMYAATTNGAGSTTAESSTNKVMTKTLDFDPTTQQFAQFAFRMPKSWNRGTITFAPMWTAASGSGGVVWALQAVALGDNVAIDTAFGTEQTSTDTFQTANRVHVAPTSAAITVAGSPAGGEWIACRIKRNPADGSDTLAVNASLLGLTIFFTTNAGDDT